MMERGSQGGALRKLVAAGVGNEAAAAVELLLGVFVTGDKRFVTIFRQWGMPRR